MQLHSGSQLRFIDPNMSFLMRYTQLRMPFHRQILYNPLPWSMGLLFAELSRPFSVIEQHYSAV